MNKSDIVSSSSSKSLSPLSHSNSSLPASIADQAITPMVQYQGLLENSREHLRESQQTWRNLIAFRTIFFLMAALLLGAIYLRLTKSNIVFASGLLFLAAFIGIAAFHERLSIRLRRIGIEIRLYTRLLARMQRDWEKIPEVSMPELDQSVLDTAEDLDLINGRSLARWVSLAGTRTGLKTLASQLTTFTDVETLRKRQEAVKELLPIREPRQKALLELWNLGSGTGTLEDFGAWVVSPFHQPRWVRILSVIGPVCLIAGIILLTIDISSTGMLFKTGVAVALVGALINIGLILTYVGAIHNVFKSVDSHGDLDSACEKWEAMFQDGQPRSELLQAVSRTLISSDNPHSAVAALKRLRIPMTFAGMRLQPLLYLPFLVLQFCMLWDFRIVNQLDRWRKKHREDVLRWIDSIGQIESLLSATAIAEEYPEWAFPSTDVPQGSLFHAHSIGHPLIADESRVVNDIMIERAHPVLLITGSNMAGKSTLMRTLGINIALSRIGAPVCAVSCACQPFELATSIRVRDSLADGVSFFMAELLRLRKVVDFVESNRLQKDRPSLVILDEILQGTNSRERQIAVSHVIQKLLQFDPLLMVSTHDLLLADMEGFATTSQVIHFREHFVEIEGKLEMRFDYKLYPGVAPTTNALKLLDLVGLS